MTKKDFELIARTIKAQAEDPAFKRINASTAHRFADALATTNPRFDRARFLRACGVEA